MITAQERKVQDRQARRRRVQDSARTVFDEKGYDGASIEHIARASQLSVGAIYLYFQSKEDLYVSLLQDALMLVDVELTQLRCQGDGETDRVGAAWKVLTSWASRDREGTGALWLLTQARTRGQLTAEVASSANAGINRVRAHLTSIVSGAGPAAGTCHQVPLDAAAVADAIWATFIGILAVQRIDQGLSLAAQAPTAPPVGTTSAAFALIASHLGGRHVPTTHGATQAGRLNPPPMPPAQ